MSTVSHEPSDIERGPLLLSMAVVVFVIILCLIVAYALTRAERGRVAMGTNPAWYLNQRSDVSQVELQVFADETDAERASRVGKVKLQSYGWVNRKQGIVHVPVDVAMQLYLAEKGRKP
jgi:hypothetical protein